MHRVVLTVLLALLPVIVAADLLPKGQSARVLPISLRDGKPMLAASIGARPGVVMFDIGTPYPIMLNRDALDLPGGEEVARGHAASGQDIVVMLHPAPRVTIADSPITLPDTLPSGNFGFTREGLGDDFLGFLGLPAVAATPFALDIARERLILMQSAPEDAATLAVVAVDLPQGGLPEWTGRIGARAARFDIDTGDGGTFYVTTTTRAALEAEGFLTGTGAAARLSGVRFGGIDFGPIDLRVVAANGVEDMREPPRGDLVRLGAGFLADHPTLWNLPRRTIAFLDPGAPFLPTDTGQQP